MTNPIDATAINPMYTGATLADELTAKDANLFGSGVDPTQPGVTPKQSQAIIDGIHQLVNGGDATGMEASTVPTNLAQFPQEYVVATPPRYTAVTVDAAGTWTPTTTSSATSLTGSHSFGPTANYLTVKVAFDLSAVPSLSVMCGSTPMTLLNTPASQRGVVAFGLAVTPGEFTTAQDVTVALNGATPPTVNFLSAESTSWIGVASAGSVVYSNAHSGASPSVVITAAINYAVDHTFFFRASGASAAMTAYSKTSLANTGNVANGSLDFAQLSGYAAGAASLTFSATTGVTGTWFSLALGLIPSKSAEPGSVFKQVRTTTATVSVVSGEQTLSAGFFNVNRINTLDLTPALTGGGSPITVGYEGTYLVKIRLALNGTATNYYACPILYQNGGVVEYGGPPIFVTVNNNNFALEAIFIVYCAAGDTLQPGVWCSTNVSNLLTGEATGNQSLWSIALMNRSYM